MAYSKGGAIVQAGESKSRLPATTWKGNLLPNGLPDTPENHQAYLDSLGPSQAYLDDQNGFGNMASRYFADAVTAGPARRLGSEIVNGQYADAGKQALNMGGTPLGASLMGGNPVDAPLFPGHDASGKLSNNPNGITLPAPGTPRPGSGGTPAGSGGGGGYTGQYQTGQGTYTSGVLSGPGAYEQWYKQHSGEYDKPTRLDNYWEGLQGRTGGQGYQPTTSQDAWGSVKSTLSGPGQGTTNAYDTSSKLSKSGSPGETMLGSAAGYFQGDNKTAAYAKKLGTGMFTQPGQAESYYDQAGGQLKGQGQGQGMAYGNAGQMQQPGAAEQNNNRVQGMLGGNNASRDFNQGLGASGFMGKNTVGNEASYFAPGLREKSNSENLYDSGNQGLNTYYDREAQKRTKALSDQMASMGVFGSGATARGLYELHGELGAAQARDMASLAAQADQAHLGRSAAAQSFAKDAGGEELARYGLGMQAAGQSDESTRGNAGLMNEASRNAQDLQLQRLFQGGQLGLQSDAEGRARIELGGTLAQNAQTGAMNRAKTGADIQKSADESMFDQGRGLADTGNMLSTQYLDRMKSSADIGLRGDQESRSRANDYFKNAGDLDTRRLDSETYNRDTAGGVDQQDAGRRLAGGNAAETAQNMFEKRERYGIQDKSALANSQAQLVQGALGKSADEQRAIYEDVINSIMAGGQATREQAEAQAQQMFQAYGIAVNAAGSISKKK